MNEQQRRQQQLLQGFQQSPGANGSSVFISPAFNFEISGLDAGDAEVTGDGFEISGDGIQISASGFNPSEIFQQFFSSDQPFQMQMVSWERWTHSTILHNSLHI